MKPIPETTLKIWEALKKSAIETLERKRKLGHYAVIWHDGKPVFIGDDAPQLSKTQK